MTEDKKKRNKRQQDWQNQSRDRVNMIFSKGFKDRVQEAAAAVGLSVSRYVETAVNEKIQRDNGNMMPTPSAEPYTIPPEVLAKIEAHREPPPPALPLPTDDIAAAPVEVLAQWLHDHGYTARQIREYLKDNRK